MCLCTCALDSVSEVRHVILFCTSRLVRQSVSHVVRRHEAEASLYVTQFSVSRHNILFAFCFATIFEAQFFPHAYTHC